MNVRKFWPYDLTFVPWFAYVAITFLAPDAGVRLYGLYPRQLFFARLGSLVFVQTYWLAGSLGDEGREQAMKLGANAITSNRSITMISPGRFPDPFPLS